MERIKQTIWIYKNGGKNLTKCLNSVTAGKDEGYEVKNFEDLVKHVAKVSWRNPDYFLLFRGQRKDHRKGDINITTLYPTIFRPNKRSNQKMSDILKTRFDDLEFAESRLIERFNFLGKKQIQTNQMARWALLQHYWTCETPLLDVTQSLRVACSFAHEKTTLQNQAYLYVIAVPQISGSITIDSGQGIQIVRLQSFSSPKALRPHFQQGYLIGDYPKMTLRSTSYVKNWEWDFTRRLLCKFILPPKNDFWTEDFPEIPEQALYPKNDDVKKLMDEIKKEVKQRNTSSNKKKI